MDQEAGVVSRRIGDSRKLRVHYRAEMVANSQSFSPSAGKPKVVVASSRRLGVPIEIVAPEPVTVDGGIASYLSAGARWLQVPHGSVPRSA